MAIEYSTALRKFLQAFGSKKQALTGGKFEIFSGSAPASPNDAYTGTKLLVVTLGGAGLTAETRSKGSVTLNDGASGSVDTITVDGVSILPAAVDFNSTLTQTALDVVSAINAGFSSPRYTAYSSGATIYIEAMPTTGTGPNSYAVVSSSTTITTTDGAMASGVDGVNGLTFDDGSLGVLSKAGVFSGDVLVSGIAGYFRMSGAASDAGGADTEPFSMMRLQGNCGTSGADYNMDSTSLVLGATHTIDVWNETLAE